jgi:hydrogenase expression/formation protein HypD
LDAVEIAQKNPNKKVVFMGVGFETTVPTIAAAVATAEKLKVNNFYLSAAHKTMPQALLALVQQGNIDLHGFILPAHVSAIIGVKPYKFLAEQYNQACVITGFEPLDILLGLLMLVRQKISKKVSVDIQYKRVVRQEGNPKAIRLIDKVFEPCDSEWRGVGVIPGSGLRLRSKYKQYNAEENIDVDVETTKENKACICGEILRGLKTPVDCTLFAKVCTPENPIGACMVSSEGTCAAYYKYEEYKRK